MAESERVSPLVSLASLASSRMPDEDRSPSASDERPRKKRPRDDASSRDRPAASRASRGSRPSRAARDEDELDAREGDEENDGDEGTDDHDLIATVAHTAKPFVAPVIVLAAIVIGFIRGPGATLLVLAAGALLLVISMLWRSVRILLGEEILPEDSMARDGPSAEEEQKRAVLRAIKDLEFERSIGKVTDEDYALLSARYRADARRLLRSIDDQLAPARKKAEELVAREIGPTGSALPSSPFESTEPPAPAVASGSSVPAARAARVATSTSPSERRPSRLPSELIETVNARPNRKSSAPGDRQSAPTVREHGPSSTNLVEAARVAEATALAAIREAKDSRESVKTASSTTTLAAEASSSTSGSMPAAPPARASMASIKELADTAKDPGRVSKNPGRGSLPDASGASSPTPTPAPASESREPTMSAPSGSSDAKEALKPEGSSTSSGSVDADESSEVRP